jgi:hypothetical protein
MARANRCIACVLIVLLASCAWNRVVEPRLHDRGAFPRIGEARGGNPLKVHMQNGDLYILMPWRLAEKGGLVTGKGQRYDPQRDVVAQGDFRIAVEDIALVESSQGRIAGLSSLGGASGLASLTVFFGTLSVVCAIDPKSCFGSCPTFYMNGDDGAPDAEGFSQSVARVLEARDIDALPYARLTDDRVSIVMRNEALETHAVRRVRLLAVPRPAGRRALATPDGRFFLSSARLNPASCRAAEGDCRSAVMALDRDERTSPANARDLATRETIDLVFPPAPPRAGIVIGARQTLLTTFVFYQTLAYLGSHAGEWLAALERGGPTAGYAAMAPARRLGGIEVDVEQADGATWCRAGSFDEPGPIAGDLQIIPLEGCAPAAGRPLRVRLRLTQGHWRLDYVALARIDESAIPIALEPERVEMSGRPQPEALRSLRGEDRRLITLPGDRYEISFRLPGIEAHSQIELFLESEGFYYEWIREEWMQEENLAMALHMFADPDDALRRLAPAFKAQEARGETVFWNSRLGR